MGSKRAAHSGDNHGKSYGNVRQELAERPGEGAVSDEDVTMASDPVSKAIGEPRYGRGKKMREYAERQRRFMVQKVQEIAQKLKLDNVEIVADASTLSGKRAKAKGLEDLPEGGFMYIFPDEFIQESKIRDIEHGQINERSDNGDTILQGAQSDNTGRVEEGSEGRSVSEGIGDALHIPTAETSVGRTESAPEWEVGNEAELKQAQAQYDKYSVLMKKELAEKEAKYAEMDSTIEAADDISNTEEDDDVLYRSSEEDSHLNQYAVENIFGGIWIRTKQEYAKFVSAVENYAFEEDGEGIAFTDNFLYAYYWNINGQPIPYASVYLNREQSQDIVNQVNQEIKDGRKDKRAKEYFDSIVGLARIFKTSNNADNGNNSSSSNRARNGRLDSSILRKGRYYNTPSLYVKTRRANEIAERFGEGAISDEGVTMASDPVSKAIGEPRYGRGKKMREYAERQRRLMAQKVQEIAQKLNLNNVEIVTDASTLSRAVILNTQH